MPSKDCHPESCHRRLKKPQSLHLYLNQVKTPLIGFSTWWPSGNSHGTQILQCQIHFLKFFLALKRPSLGGAQLQTQASSKSLFFNELGLFFFTKWPPSKSTRRLLRNPKIRLSVLVTLGLSKLQYSMIHRFSTTISANSSDNSIHMIFHLLEEGS